MKKQTVGVIDKGKGNTFVDSSFSGFDVGLKVEGEDHFSLRNRFTGSKVMGKNWYEKWWVIYISFPLIVGIVLVMLGIFIKS